MIKMQALIVCCSCIQIYVKVRYIPMGHVCDNNTHTWVMDIDMIIKLGVLA